MGLVAAGVNGIKLRAGDEVVGAGIASRKGDILFISNLAMANGSIRMSSRCRAAMAWA